MPFGFVLFTNAPIKQQHINISALRTSSAEIICCYNLIDFRWQRPDGAAAGEIPEPPKILIMDIKVVMSPHLLGNMIILSKDVGEALEKAISEAKT